MTPGKEPIFTWSLPDVSDLDSMQSVRSFSPWTRELSARTLRRDGQGVAAACAPTVGSPTIGRRVHYLRRLSIPPCRSLTQLLYSIWIWVPS